jgi:hypothetical protein
VSKRYVSLVPFHVKTCSCGLKLQLYNPEEIEMDPAKCHHEASKWYTRHSHELDTAKTPGIQGAGDQLIPSPLHFLHFRSHNFSSLEDNRGGYALLFVIGNGPLCAVDNGLVNDLGNGAVTGWAVVLLSLMLLLSNVSTMAVAGWAVVFVVVMVVLFNDRLLLAVTPSLWKVPNSIRAARITNLLLSAYKIPNSNIRAARITNLLLSVYTPPTSITSP